MKAKRTALIANALAHYALAFAVVRFASGRQRTVFTLPMNLFAASIALSGTGAALRSLSANGRYRTLAIAVETSHAAAVASTAIVTLMRMPEMLDFPVANVDALTQLDNRDAFYRKVDAAIQDPKRRSDDASVVAVIYVDVDDFKEINDSFGHRTGDDVLRTIAMRLNSTAHAVSAAGRLGGDEFALLLRCRTAAQVEVFIDELRSELASAMAIGKMHLHVEVSLGAAIAAASTRDATELVHLADLAMYERKAAKR